MSEVTMQPETEDLLKQVITSPGKISRWQRGRLLVQLDKLIQLQMRKLITLQNLRDAVAQQDASWARRL
jgi:hypothetical protein